MEPAAIATAVFSLVGVALGTVGSLMGVFYAQRTAREQMKLQHRKAMRDEQKEVLLGYLAAVEDSWVFLDGLWGRQPLVSKSGDPLADEAVDREAARRNHDVWFHQQKINLVCSARVRVTALELTKCLYQATFKRDRIDAALWQFVEPAQERLLEAARVELDVIAAEPGRGTP